MDEHRNRGHSARHVSLRISPTASRRGDRPGGALPIVIGTVTIAVLSVAAILLWLRSDSAGADPGAEDLFEIRQGDFNIVIPASGELAALHQVEIRNPLDERAVITWIIDEGEHVEEGDVLIRFADDEIRTEIQDEELDVLEAQTAVTAAESELSIQKSENASRLSKAQLDVEIAILALEQWKEGEVKSAKESLRVALETAQMNADRLKEKFEESQKLFAKGHISKDEFRRDEISTKEAQLALKLAEIDQINYDKYQYEIEKKQKESDLKQAEDELARVVEQNEAALKSKEDDLKTKQGQLAIRQARLAEYQKQLAKCTVKAPRPGLVVYASSLESSGWRRDDRSAPQIGTELHRNDLVIVLPDVSQMIASVKVHETMSGQIEAGQPATVVSDAVPNLVLHGTVHSKGVMAETGSWRDPNRRDYTVKILLHDAQGLGLKPSMRCKADILVDRVVNVPYIPIQAVFHSGGRPFVYTPRGSGYAQGTIELGRSSEVHVEILAGLEPGDRVLLREPKSNEIVSRLPAPKGAAQAEVTDSPLVSEEGQSDEGRSADEPVGVAADENRGKAFPRSDADSAGPPRRGGPDRGGDRGGNPAAMLARLDANGDGMLQRSEVPEQMLGFFDQADTNGDGSIDASEMQAMQGAGGP